MRKIQNQKGAALIIVLALLIVILGLAITFLNRVSIERTSSASYASAANTRQLADTAVNLVQGQIRAATTQGDNIAWASQPGMIRTYGSGSGNSSTASSNLLKAFKLYSADNMVQTSSASLTTEDAPASTWATDKAVWTDLNAPVTVTYNGTDTVQFPIIDPAVIGSVTGLSANSTTGLSVVAGNTTTRRLPMPVRWLYITQNGSLIAATGTGNTTTISGANATTNPIIGRIAFWTDDESSKININTAAGDLQGLGNSTAGAFWDTPKNATPFELKLAKNQPLNKEYQRYPGHPATVSLSSVMGNLTTRAQIADIAPRIAAGGSAGGTNQTVSTNGTTASVGNLTIDSDRLYSSVDELAFTQNRASSILTPSSISTYGFLLTTTSRAPELNLFGKPKVSLWPLSTTNSTWTAYDQLINQCATMGNYSYSITRTDPNSSTTDYNARNTQIYTYLQSLTGNLTPGFGNATFKTKYPTVTLNGTTTSISQRDQILTELLDYIRCTNIRDTQTGATPFTTVKTSATGTTTRAGQVNPLRIGNTMGFGRMTTISEASLVFMATDCSNSVVFPYFYGSNGSFEKFVYTTPQATGMKALLVFEFFSPSLGYPYIEPGMKLSFDGALICNGVSYPFVASDEYVHGSMNSVNARPMGGGNGPASMLVYRDSATTSTGRKGIGSATASVWKFSFITSATIPLTGNANSTSSEETFSFEGLKGNLTISSSDGSTTGATTQIQSIALNFPAATLPAPKVSPIMDPGLRLLNANPLTTDLASSSVGYATKWQFLIYPEDTVISLEPNGVITSGGNKSWGDFRMVSMMQNIPESLFIPHKNYSSLNATSGFSAINNFWSTTLGGNTTISRTVTIDGILQTPVFFNKTLTIKAANSLTINNTSTTNGTKTIYTCSLGAGNYTLLSSPLLYASANEITTPTLISTVGSNKTYSLSPTWISSGNTTWKTQNNSTITRSAYNNKAHSLRLGIGNGYLGMNSSAIPTQSGVAGSLYQTISGTDMFGTWSSSGGNYAVEYLCLNSSKPQVKYQVSGVTTLNATFTRNGVVNFAPITTFSNLLSLAPDYPSGTTYSLDTIDFDTGLGITRDGPYINYPDGSSASSNSTSGGNDAVPYFTWSASNEKDNTATFSPNRQVASAVQFGSLPAGLNPWRTLLFRPGNTTSGKTHPSANTSPKDYLLLDFFWMPVVEPYAISEPSSTAGRVNMNYQILPFSYIERTAPMRAVLDSVMLTALTSTTATAQSYKQYSASPAASLDSRFRLSANETLTSFNARFTANDIFKSPAEICDIPLVPLGQTASTMGTYWDSKLLTGDNLRESPYKHLYPLLTTKSNTYTIHFRVQALKKVPSTSATFWDETKDKVVGEYRGSTTIERYINPNDTSIPDYAANPGANNLERFYKWRVLNNRQFAP
jgi:hypothetical protein